LQFYAQDIISKQNGEQLGHLKTIVQTLQRSSEVSVEKRAKDIARRCPLGHCPPKHSQKLNYIGASKFLFHLVLSRFALGAFLCAQCTSIVLSFLLVLLV